MITLHWFDPKDLIETLKLVNTTLGENYDPNFFLNIRSIWPEGCILAKSGDIIVGAILATINAKTNARILILSVEEKYRNQGIGDRLLRALIYQCYQKNLNIIQLEVRVNNNNAIKFYTRKKFIIERVLPGYYKNGDNGYLMYKILR
jgi:ribosomal protein S18 acetylase RimI-like enzyme